MDAVVKKKRGIAAIWKICPLRHLVLLVSLLLTGFHLFLRHNEALAETVSADFIRPALRLMARYTAHLPFSLAEALIAAAVLGLLSYTVFCIYRMAKGKERLASLYKMLVTPFVLAFLVYALFSSLWGAFFYIDDFAETAGIESGPVSTDQLAAVTEYFARLANEYSEKVSRDENGVCSTDRESVIEASAHIFDNTEKLFPQLEGEDVPVKGIVFSKIMSYLDFTGFFFPITGEANVNLDFPPSQFAATVAHEISHQRGVAREQEANFVAVLASLESGDADYCYSAALLAYTHLGNALHSADYNEWQRIYRTLNDHVLRDFAADRAYWQQFETPVQEVSNSFYDGFLHSYDQHLGLKSYGACVDLLVNYYYDEAVKKD
ncbi:MAG: DUF3810 domain-containing protein [Oscillospiraceae bacterium]|nr:DUF3810 domain-containing protein [Oscillospiraceae bacterium]